MLTATTHREGGRGARAADARCRKFVCEVCRVRAQCGHAAEDEAGDRLRELERVRLLTLWAGSTDKTMSGVAGGVRKLAELDAALPSGCPAAAPPSRRTWPPPLRTITLQWHQLSIMRTGGRSESGMRTVGGLKSLRSAMFNLHREQQIDNPLTIRLAESKLMDAPGSAPTDSVGNEMFVRGLEATLGSRAVKADAMPPSVARAIERDLTLQRQSTRSAWGRYDLAAARLANVQLYSNFLRGDEPWKQKYSTFRRQPYLDQPCPTCGHNHALLTVDERWKMSNRGFDLVLATPVTGAGLSSGRAVTEMLEARAEVARLLTANGTPSDHLFVKQDGKPWDNDYFFRGIVVPILRRLVTARHPGTIGMDLADSRRTTIRVYRRGGETFVKKANVDPDLVDLMGRWRPQQRTKEPAIMRQRYYSMTCEDGYLVTAAAPPRTSVGFAAWYPFERMAV